jgi:hypothetical protein
MKEKTPLQTLEEWLTFQMQNATPNTSYVFGLVRGQVEQLIPVEQTAIEHAYVAGFAEADTYETPKDYFQRKYKTEEQ